MGKMNLLKADWTGKVGQTVGAKWKNKSTIRTYSIPADPKTQAQLDVRDGFKWISSFVALFADQIRYLSALNTAGMSVRNAIIKLNKDLIKNDTAEYTDLEISKGGLQTPSGVTASYDTTSGKVSFTWTKPVATNFNASAKAIMVVVDPTDKVAVVAEAGYDAESGEVSVGTGLTGDKIAYLYFLDKRGSANIGSVSVSLAVTNA